MMPTWYSMMFVCNEKMKDVRVVPSARRKVYVCKIITRASVSVRAVSTSSRYFESRKFVLRDDSNRIENRKRETEQCSNAI